jgi:hypothetical protein
MDKVQMTAWMRDSAFGYWASGDMSDAIEELIEVHKFERPDAEVFVRGVHEHIEKLLEQLEAKGLELAAQFVEQIESEQ